MTAKWTSKLVGLCVALLIVGGCQPGETPEKAERPAITVEPHVAPSTKPLDDLKKDIQPPVVVKPNETPTTPAQPVGPKP